VSVVRRNRLAAKPLPVGFTVTAVSRAPFPGVAWEVTDPAGKRWRPSGAFYDDHTLDRDLPAPPVLRQNAKHYWVDNAHPDFTELIDDARFYTHPHGPRGSYGNARYTNAALALLRATGRAT